MHVSIHSNSDVNKGMIQRIEALIPKMPSPELCTAETSISHRYHVALNALGSIVYKTKGKYMDEFLPYLLSGLR